MVRNMNAGSDQMSRKEREAALRRESILLAARQIFEVDGYFNATMAQIAARAEFGVGTLYQFFPSKQHLFAEVIIAGIEQFKQGLKDAVEEKASWQDKLKAFVSYQLEWIEQNPEFHRLIYEIFYSPIPDLASHVFEIYKDIHKETMGLIQDIFIHANKDIERFDSELMSLMILGILHVIGDSWFMNLLNKTPSTYTQGILRIITGGEISE